MWPARRLKLRQPEFNLDKDLDLAKDLDLDDEDDARRESRLKPEQAVAQILRDHEDGSEKPLSQTNYIDVARRALAARTAAEAAAQAANAERKKRPAANDERSGFVRPLALGEKPDGAANAGGRMRVPAIISMAGIVLALGAFQAYRYFQDGPFPPMQASLFPPERLRLRPRRAYRRRRSSPALFNRKS